MEKWSSLPVIVPTRSYSLVKLPASLGRCVEASLQRAANIKLGYVADLRSFEDCCQHSAVDWLI
jgi:hypothetical protein